MAAEQAKATIVDADIYVESFGNIEEANMVRKRLCLYIYLLVFLEIVFSKFPFFSFLTGFVRSFDEISEEVILFTYFYVFCLFFWLFPLLLAFKRPVIRSRGWERGEGYAGGF